MARTLLALSCLLLLAFAPTTVSAQDGAMQYDTTKVVPPPEARPSPMRVAQAMLGNTYVKVTYGSPLQRGRTLFGEGDDALEAYGEVWRLGANEATELTATGDLQLGDETLPAGTYTLFAIPGPDTWTLVVNSALGQWGAYQYDESLDVARLDLPVMEPAKSFEAFTIDFEDQPDGSKHLAMMWGDVKVAVPVAAP